MLQLNLDDIPDSERLDQGSPIDTSQYDTSYVSQTCHALMLPLPSTNQRVVAQAMPCSERLDQGSPIDTRQYNASYVSQTHDALTPPLPSTNQQVATQVIPRAPPSATSAKHHHETLMKDKPGNTKKSRMKGASKENTKPTTDAAATATIKEDEILAKTSRSTGF